MYLDYRKRLPYSMSSMSWIKFFGLVFNNLVFKFFLFFCQVVLSKPPIYAFNCQFSCLIFPYIAVLIINLEIMW